MEETKKNKKAAGALGAEETKAQRRKKRKRKAMLWNVALIVALIVLAVSVWQLVTILMGYYQVESTYDNLIQNMEQQTVPVPVPSTTKAAEDESATAEETQETEEDIDFEEETEKVYSLTVPNFDYLKSVNSDVIGWIQIPGTRINYPVVQGTDNEYYLTHTVTGEENSGGAIFMDAAVTNGFKDKNPIIHGHNLKSGDMFSRLNRYSRRSFWDTYRYVYITTPEDGLMIYEVFSAYIVDPDADIYYFGFSSDDTFQAYLDRVKSYSIYDAGITVTKEDTIVTLSTCTNDTTQRFIVHAKRVE